MKNTKRSSVYEKYKNDQVSWTFAEDLMLVLAKELVQLKEKKGMNLFWDDSEEELMRAYIKSPEALAQS